MVLPWYIYAALIVAGIFLFDNFYESAPWIIIVEILYGLSSLNIFDHTFMIWMIAACVTSLIIKRSTRFYQ